MTVNPVINCKFLENTRTRFFFKTTSFPVSHHCCATHKLPWGVVGYFFLAYPGYKFTQVIYAEFYYFFQRDNTEKILDKMSNFELDQEFVPCANEPASIMGVVSHSLSGNGRENKPVVTLLDDSDNEELATIDQECAKRKLIAFDSDDEGELIISDQPAGFDKCAKHKPVAFDSDDKDESFNKRAKCKPVVTLLNDSDDEQEPVKNEQELVENEEEPVENKHQLLIDKLLGELVTGLERQSHQGAEPAWLVVMGEYILAILSLCSFV